MRINDPSGLGQLASAPNGRTNETASVQSAGSSGTRGAGSAASDRVELSSFTGRLSESLTANSADRAQRVAQLKAAVQSGNYQTDAAAISRSILDHSLAGNRP